MCNSFPPRSFRSTKTFSTNALPTPSYVVSVYGGITRAQMWQRIRQTAGLVNQIDTIHKTRTHLHNRLDLFVNSTSRWKTIRTFLRQLLSERRLMYWRKRGHKRAYQKPNLSLRTKRGTLDEEKGTLKSSIRHSAFSMATWNVSSYRRRTFEVQEFLAKYRPTVLALVETRHRFEREVSIPGYQVIQSPSIGRRQRKWGIALYIDSQVCSNVETLELVLGREVWVSVMIGGSKLTLGAVYVPPNITSGLSELGSRIKRYQSQADQTFVLGDFNSESLKVWQQCQTRLDARKRLEELSHSRKRSRRLDRMVQSRNLVYGKYTTAPSTFRNGASAIDYILHPAIPGNRWEISAIDFGSSDHRPLLSRSAKSINTLFGERLPSTNVKPQSVFSSRSVKLRKDEILKSLKARSDDFAKSGENGSIREWYDTLESARKDLTKPARSPKKPKLFVMSQRIRKLFRERRKADRGLRVLRQRRNMGLPVDRSEWECRLSKYKTSCKAYRTEVRAELKRREAILWSQCKGNKLRGDVWSLLRKTGILEQRRANNTQTYPVINRDGERLEGQAAMEQWAHYFESLFTKRPVQGSQIPAPAIFKHSDDLTRPIGVEELKLAIGRLQLNKASGLDDISYECIKLFTTSPKLLESLRASLSGALSTPEQNPEIWDHALIHPLHKKQSRLECDNYRAISLLSCVFKLLYLILAIRLSTRLEREGFFIPEQLGFRSGGECTAQCITLVEILERRRKQGLSSFVCFIDFAKAYDSIDRQALFTSLRLAGLSVCELRLWQHAYRSPCSRVKIGRFLSRSFRNETGLLQGATCSPLLFSIYINSVLDDIDEADLGVQIDHTNYPIHKGKRRKGFCGALIADDIVLVSPTFEKLNQSVSKVAEWATYWGLNFGIQKCGWFEVCDENSNSVICRNTSTEDEDPRRLRCKNAIIPKVSSYRYLGTEICSNLSFRQELEIRRRCAIRVRTGLGTLLSRLTKVHPLVKLGILNSTFIPTVLYGCEVWLRRRDQLKPIQAIYDQCLKQIMGLKASEVAGGIIRAELGQPSLHYLSRERILKGIRRWKGKNHTWWIFKLIESLTKVGTPRNGPLGAAVRWTKSQMTRLKSDAVASITIGEWDLERVLELLRQDDIARATELNLKYGHRSASARHYMEYAGRPGVKPSTYLRVDVPHDKLEALNAFLAFRVNGFRTVPRLIHAGSLSPRQFSEGRQCFCGEVNENYEHIFLKCSVYQRIRPSWVACVRQQCGYLAGDLFERSPEDNQLRMLLGGPIEVPGTLASRRNVIIKSCRRWSERIQKDVLVFIHEMLQVRKGYCLHDAHMIPCALPSAT